MNTTARSTAWSCWSASSRPRRGTAYQPVLALLAGLLLLALPARGQDELLVASVSDGGTLQTPDGQTTPLEIRTLISAGRIAVPTAGQIMCVSRSGAAIVLLGPAQVDFVADTTQTRLSLAAGRVMAALTQPQPGYAAMTLTVEPLVALQLAPGMTYLHRPVEGVRADVAYASTADATLSLLVRGAQRTLRSGQVLTITETADEAAPAGAWLAKNFDLHAIELLGLLSAQEVRGRVAGDLFENIVQWDQRAGAGYVLPKITAARFEPEIRQVAISITRLVQPTGAARAVTRTIPVPAANEVPPLSPAALSVLNIAEGVTAIVLNRNARDLLTATGSQGLGFRGPSLLALPGFGPAGTRTVGPAGLGAQP